MGFSCKPKIEQNMNIYDNPAINAKVLVVFSGKTDLWFLAGLATGFKYCFALVEQSAGWILYDPLSNRSVIMFYENLTKEEVVAWYEHNDCKVVEAVIDDCMPIKMAPLLPYTCVEAVKRLLGIHRWLLFSPRQLFNFLIEQNRNKLLKEINNGK